MIVFGLALIRFLLVGLVELNVQINAITGDVNASSEILTFSFSYLLVGQLIDNTMRVKQIFVLMECCFAIWVLAIASTAYFQRSVFNQPDNGLWQVWNYYLLPTDLFFVGAIQLIQTIQLFNWFSKRRIGTIMGCFMGIQTLGMILRFYLTDSFDDFPDENSAADNAINKSNFFKQNGNICMVIGYSFIVIAIFDMYQFFFHPLEKNVTVNLNDNKLRQTDFRILAIERHNSQMPEFEGKLLGKEENIYSIVD
jgi:hypothetical protein